MYWSPRNPSPRRSSLCGCRGRPPDACRSRARGRRRWKAPPRRARCRSRRRRPAVPPPAPSRRFPSRVGGPSGRRRHAEQLLGAYHRDGRIPRIAVGADLVSIGLAHRRAADHHLDAVADSGLFERIDGALHGGHGRGHERRDPHDLRPVLLDGRDELLRRHVTSEVVDLEARALQHHGDQVLADVVEVALGRADDDHAERLPVATRLGDEGLEEVEPGIHRAGREQHLGHVVLVTPELLAHHVHAGDQAPEDQFLRVHGEGEALLGLAGHGVLVAQNQRPRHDGIVEVFVHAPCLRPPVIAGYPALVHSRMPPATLYQPLIPALRSALIAELERSPPAQSTALGRSAGSSRMRSTAWPMGRLMAPAMCPSSHSEGSRTSTTTSSARSSSMVARSCTVICGTRSSGSPSLFQSVIPRWRYPAMSSMPARPSPCTARVRSDGPVARSTKRLLGGVIIATRAANGLLSIHTLTAPGMCPSPYSSGLRTSSATAPLASASRACATESGSGSPSEGSDCERFLAMMRSKPGGLGGRPV